MDAASFERVMQLPPGDFGEASPGSRRVVSTYRSGRAVEIDPATRTVTRVLGVDGDTYELLYSIEGGNAAFENFSYEPYTTKE